MKRLLLIYAIVAIYLGLCSPVEANLTMPQSGSNQNGAIRVKDDSDNPDGLFEECLSWIYEHLFGRDWGRKKWVYLSGSGGSGGGPGDGGSGGSPGDGGWGGDPGDGGWGGGPGDGGWGGGPGDGGWGGGPGDGGWGGGPGSGGWGGGPGGGGSDTCPVQPIPAPGAIILSGIGLSFLSWLRRRHIV